MRCLLTATMRMKLARLPSLHVCYCSTRCWWPTPLSCIFSFCSFFSASTGLLFYALLVTYSLFSFIYFSCFQHVDETLVLRAAGDLQPFSYIFAFCSFFSASTGRLFYALLVTYSLFPCIFFFAFSASTGLLFYALLVTYSPDRRCMCLMVSEKKKGNSMIL